jgi:hypothetical protein
VGCGRYFEELVLSKDLTTGVIKRGQTTGADTPPPPSTASPEDGDAPVAGTGATKNAEHATTVAAEGGVAAAIPAVVRFVDGGIAVRIRPEECPAVGACPMRCAMDYVHHVLLIVLLRVSWALVAKESSALTMP